MTHLSGFCRALVAGTVACTSALALAQSQAVEEPSEVIDGFAATCQRGFPDLNQVGHNAVAAGWAERQTRIPSGSSLPAGIVLPRMFGRGRAMMGLVQFNPTSSGGATPNCQVTALTKGKPRPEEIAALVAQRLALGPPAWAGKGDETVAAFRTPSGTVNASIARYNRARSYMLKITR